jgi:3-keto-5-aminohexanoate cleavage enzyme
MDRHTLAPSNAALVRRTVELAAEAGRPVADAATARRILGLSAVPMRRVA